MVIGMRLMDLLTPGQHKLHCLITHLFQVHIQGTSLAHFPLELGCVEYTFLTDLAE